MKEIEVTMADGTSRIFKISVPKDITTHKSNLEESDYIDNWLIANVGHCRGWRLCR